MGSQNCGHRWRQLAALRHGGGAVHVIRPCLAMRVDMNRAKLLERLRSSLWFIPLLYAVLGLVISAFTMFVDQRSDYELVSMDFIGGPDAALAILGTVAASMVSLLATVLAITMVVVQLAMAQFSPRIVQTFLQDRPSQNAIGLFVATFVVAMLSMRGVQVGDDPVVPGFSVLVVFMLVVVDIVVLVNYIHHIGRSLRVSALIELVGKNTRSLLDETYPHSVELVQDQRSEDPHVVGADNSGVLSLIGHEHLVELATEVDGTIEVIPALGQYVPAGSPLVRLRGVPPPTWTWPGCAARCSSAWTARCSRTSRSACGCSLTWGSRRSRRAPSRTRPRPSRSSTASTT